MAKIKEFEIIGKREQVIRLSDKLFPLYIVKGDKNFLIDSGAAAMAVVFHERITNALKQFGPRREFSKSSFMGPREAILINIKAMIKNVTKELPLSSMERLKQI